MSQSKTMSAVESTTQIVVGFCVAWALWVWVVGPLFGYETSAEAGFWITVLFTVASFIRQYIMRRIFNFYGTK